MIVKIERCQSPSPEGQVLIHSQNGYWWEGEADPFVDEWLGNRQQAYAHAHMHEGHMVIEKAAKYQDW